MLPPARKHDWFRGARINAVCLLYLRTARDAADVREGDAGVLRNLAEKVLTVDQVQPSVAEVLEAESETLELSFLVFDHPLNCRGG